jgi:hypothetical protein
MKRILTTAMVVAGLVAGFSASAIQYSDTDTIGATLSVGTPYAGNFNISAGDGDFGDVGGFNPLTQTIISASAGFTFLDLNQTANTVSITLDTATLVSGGVIDQVLTSFNGAVVGTAYVSLNSNGVLDYQIELLSGNPVVLVMASLTAQAGDKVIGVPDGGTTLGMLGCGLLAASWVCRRLRLGTVTR